MLHHYDVLEVSVVDKEVLQILGQQLTLPAAKFVFKKALLERENDTRYAVITEAGKFSRGDKFSEVVN